MLICLIDIFYLMNHGDFLEFIKKYFIIIALLGIIFSAAAVSAADASNDTAVIGQTDQIASDNCLSTGETGNFTELNVEIGKIHSGGNLTLEKDYVYTHNDSDFKWGIKITEDNIVIDGDGHTIDGAGQARIFNITSSNVTLKNINFINGFSIENGGAISSVEGLNILDSTFHNNTANKSGGAVYIEGAFSNSIINSTFINNSAYNGGALYFNGATANSTIKGYFEGNNAERAAGAIYLKGKSENNIISSEFYYNRANRASGGAIFFYNLSQNNLFESTFRYNFGIYGAGIFFYNKANNNRFNSDFRLNVAKSCGGALFFHNTTDNNTFTGYFINNFALGQVDENGNGGAITFKDESSNSIFTCDFINNTAARNGGGVNYRSASHNITFNSNFINNKADNGGGVNFFENFDDIIFNGEFVGNSALYGGAIAAKGGVVKNVIFMNNRAESGGAVYFNDTGEVLNCEFDNNTITDEFGDGGAVYFNNGGTVSDSTFTNNNAGYSAGAVYFAGQGTINNSYFENNSAGNYGGAIYLENNGTVSNCNFTGNRAGYDGGAVSFWKNGKISYSNFKNNYAQNGGSLYIHSDFEVDGCNFTGNKARTGGAIELWGNGTLRHSNFNDNVGQFSGGAVYINYDIKIDGCNFTNNSAEENEGGALYIFGNGQLTDCRFINNKALRYGGAIYFNKNGTIDESTFENNSAADGGAILATHDLAINDSTFKDNSATLGTNHVSLKGNATIALNNVDPINLGPFYIVQLKIINSSDVTYGDSVKITVNVSSKGVPINNGNVSVVINSKIYYADVINGTATIEIPNLDAGSYACDVVFGGYENYASTTENVNFKVNKQNITVTAGSKYYIINYGGKYSVTIKDINGNLLSSIKVTFTLNGKAVGTATTNSDGVATITLTAKMLKTAKAGKRNLVIKTSHANYNTVSKTVKITINKENTRIIAKAKSFRLADKTKKYVIILKDSKNKVIKNTMVYMRVNAFTYSAKTDCQGQATFKLTKLNKMGRFNAIVQFKGNAYYKIASRKVIVAVR